MSSPLPERKPKRKRSNNAVMENQSTSAAQHENSQIGSPDIDPRPGLGKAILYCNADKLYLQYLKYILTFIKTPLRQLMPWCSIVA